jgi:AcrR family transcriptional regulator
VREAILDATAALVAERGLLSVTMSQIAEATGIGRATLYKYFPDVEAILVAWHERQVTAHIHHLMSLPDQGSSPGERLAGVLTGYAIMSRQHDGTEFSSLLHHGEHVRRAQQHLSDYIQVLVVDAVQSGEVRDDIPPTELVSYCLHALQAATDLQDPAAVHRLVEVTLAGIKRSLPAIGEQAADGCGAECTTRAGTACPQPPKGRPRRRLSSVSPYDAPDCGQPNEIPRLSSLPVGLPSPQPPHSPKLMDK